MSETKIAKSWGAGCARTAFVAIVALILFVFVFVGLVVVSQLLPLQREQQITLWSSAFFIALILAPVILLIFGIWFVRRRLQRVDVAFAPFGLLEKSYLWNGRQYHGLLSDRQVDAYFYRGPALDVYVSSAINTRLGIGLKGVLTRLAASSLQRTPLETNDPGFDLLSINALDENWGRQLLAEPRAREIILRLATSPPGLEFRNLLFQPEAIQFQLNRMDLDTLTTENLRQWLNELLELAAIAESLPPPAVTATASPLEHKARVDRGNSVLPAGIAFGVLAFIVLFALVACIILGLLQDLGSISAGILRLPIHPMPV